MSVKEEEARKLLSVFNLGIGPNATLMNVYKKDGMPDGVLCARNLFYIDGNEICQVTTEMLNIESPLKNATG